MFAILNSLPVQLKVIAVCELWTYDVWGNEEDGWTVNDMSCRDRKLRVPAAAFVSEFPRYPGASDDHRSFSKSSSFSCEVVASFVIQDETLIDLFGHDFIEVESDGEIYYVNREDGYPLGEIRVLKWESGEEEE